MTNKMFHPLAILALAFFSGQTPQSMAQSIPVPDGIGPIALRESHRLHLSRKPRAVVSQNSAPQQDAVAPAKTKVYKFRTVDYPAATNTPIFDYNDGIAVGDFLFGNSDESAFYYKGTTNYILTAPGSYAGGLAGINAHGQMVGGYDDSKGGHGFLYDGKNFTTLDFPKASYTSANGINSSGEIVGVFVDINQIAHGFSYIGGTFTQLDCPNSGATSASGINSSGEIVGSCFYNSTYHGFLLANGTYTAIDFPGGTLTDANGINDAGAIAGDYEDTTTTHGFTYVSGLFTQVDVGGGAVATALNRITNTNNLVGYYQDAVGELHGVIGK
jgi:hypothetical protein